jgi:hypothetical protein
MDPASGVVSRDPATPNTIEYTFLSLPDSRLIKHGQVRHALSIIVHPNPPTNYY